MEKVQGKPTLVKELLASLETVSPDGLLLRAELVLEKQDIDRVSTARHLQLAAARLATYEAALRELVAACTTGDTYSDGRAAGVRTPEREVLERARKALEDNT